MVADDRLLEKFSASVGKGVEIAIGKEAYSPSRFSPDWPDSREELRETVDECRGSTVLVGEAPAYPDRYWEVDETEEVSVVSTESR
jgi:hypothetical protein